MTTDPQIEITRLKFTVCEQATEINRLRDEIDRLLGWINGDSDALTCLQTVYNSSTSSETNKVKAAAAAIGYERPRMTPLPTALGKKSLLHPLERAALEGMIKIGRMESYRVRSSACLIGVVAAMVMGRV